MNMQFMRSRFEKKNKNKKKLKFHLRLSFAVVIRFIAQTLNVKLLHQFICNDFDMLPQYEL